MKPLLKIITSTLIVVTISFFNTRNIESPENLLNLDHIDVENILKNQKFECRPSSDFVFDVQTNILKKIRGGTNINAKIFIVDRITERKILVAQEHILVKNFKDAIGITDYRNVESNLKITELSNGDKIVRKYNNTLHSFKELLKYDFIYNTYILSTNKLLQLKRSI